MGAPDHNCPHETVILDLKNLGPIIHDMTARQEETQELVKNLAKAHTETLAIVKSLADQDKRILYVEIDAKENKKSINHAFDRIRKLENVPMFFPEWKKALLLLATSWMGSAAMILVFSHWRR